MLPQVPLAIAAMYAIRGRDEVATRSLLADIWQLGDHSANIMVRIYNALGPQDKNWLKTTIGSGMSRETYQEAGERISKNFTQN